MNGPDSPDAHIPLCPEGTLIKGRWRVSYQIGMGAFGEIYVARNVRTNERVAIKVEIADEKKQALRAEVAIMRRLQGCPYVCQFISCGRQGNINFLVMELLGTNLSELRKKQPRLCFSMLTVCRLTCEMVECLRALHGMGVLHRDVKPSNFVLGGKYSHPDAQSKLYIIDFGLSHKFVGQDGKIKPPRPNAGFRGTARYASVNSHHGRELSPRDDLWSVLYMIIEFTTGSLPWRSERDRDKVGAMKEKYMTGKKLVRGLPQEFEEFMAHLLSLGYSDTPDYDLIIGIFRSLMLRIMGLPLSYLDPSSQFKPPAYDWEAPASAEAAAGSVSGTVSSAQKERFKLFRKKNKPYKDPVGSAGVGLGANTGGAFDTQDALSPRSKNPADPPDPDPVDDEESIHDPVPVDNSPGEGKGKGGEEGDDERSSSEENKRRKRKNKTGSEKESASRGSIRFSTSQASLPKKHVSVTGVPVTVDDPNAQKRSCCSIM